MIDLASFVLGWISGVGGAALAFYVLTRTQRRVGYQPKPSVILRPQPKKP